MMHWLKKYRLKNGLSRAAMAKKVRNRNTGCSAALIAILEQGGITHPGIADRIAAVTGATARQRDSLVHESRRGKWTLPKNKKYSDFETRKRPQPMTPGCTAINAREVVQIDKGGFEIGRYNSMSLAAMNAGCSVTTVENRCKRKRRGGTNEFFFYDCTFRFADEWDGMNLEERWADIHPGAH